MIKLLIKRFIPNYLQTQDRVVRERYSVLGGALGIVCNTFLFALKLIIGTLMGSLAITSDAFNNLSDMGSSLVAIIGAKMSNRRPDKEHPFGHGRIEYVSALIVSFLIMMVGLELLRGAFDKILHPELTQFHLGLTVILVLSVLVKVWMFLYNRYIGRTIQSGVMLAAASDSLNDVAATSAVIVSTVIGQLFRWPIDGYISFAVALLVMYTGFGIAKDTVTLLLGKAPDPQMVREIEDMVLSYDGIVGVHDLIVHDYGPGRTIATVHAEVPDDADVVKIHEIIDRAEQEIFQALNIHMVIHMDPITVNNQRTDALKAMVTGILSAIDPALSIHDFRITDGENRINLIFDMVVPYGYTPKQQEALVENLKEQIARRDPRCCCVIQVDQAFL